MVPDIFYRAVVQAVLLFRSETWELSVVNANILKEVHVGFLHQVAEKIAWRQWGRLWKSKGAEIFLREIEMQNLGKYMDRQQTTAADWVALRSI